MKFNQGVGIAATCVAFGLLQAQDATAPSVVSNEGNTGTGWSYELTASGDLLLGSGYVTVPIGYSLGPRGSGNGEFNEADRTGALYLGSAVQLKIDGSAKKPWQVFDIEASQVEGRSRGVFDDLSWIAGNAEGIFSAGSYQLDDSIFQFRLRQRFMKVGSSEWYWGFGYINVQSELDGQYALRVVMDPDSAELGRGLVNQRTQDHLGSMTVSYEYLDLDDLLAKFRLSKSEETNPKKGGDDRDSGSAWMTFREKFHLNLRADLGLFLGARNTELRETFSEAPEPGAARVNSMIYGGDGRFMLKATWTLYENKESERYWYLYGQAGVQARYLINEWDRIPFSGGADRINVRGAELLWGPYFQAGILYSW
jgi:hypothetical protein